MLTSQEKLCIKDSEEKWSFKSKWKKFELWPTGDVPAVAGNS